MEMKEVDIPMRVRIYRAKYCLTQQQLADACGISRRALQKVEHGDAISFKTLVSILSILDDDDEICKDI